MERTEKGTFAKGHKGLKPKGSKHKSTELRTKIDEIIFNEMENLPYLLSTIEKPEIRAKLLIDLLPYKIPKLQSIGYSHEVTAKIEALPKEQFDILINEVKELMNDENFTGNENFQKLFATKTDMRKLPSWLNSDAEIVE